MDKRRFNLMVNYSIYGTEVLEEDWYTEEEFDKGYHFCQEWDDLFIAPGTPEWECCVCHPLKNVGDVKYIAKHKEGLV